MSDFLIV